jgi:6-phosphofructokinase 1
MFSLPHGKRTIRLDESTVSGSDIGGTIWAPAADKPHKMPVGGLLMDMTESMVENFRKHHMKCCFAWAAVENKKRAALKNKGLNVITCPKPLKKMC